MVLKNPQHPAATKKPYVKPAIQTNGIAAPNIYTCSPGSFFCEAQNMCIPNGDPC